jgi:glycosyltransferase involved in cell wall biosynthesis
VPAVPAVSVIVPARDAARTLPDTLAGLAAQDAGGDMEVIVVDDASRDATGALARAAPAVDRVLSGAGDGPAAARNRGAAVARGRALAFLDADCVPAPGWLAAGLTALRDADLVQGAVRPPDGAAPGPFDRTLWVDGEHGLYETANLFATCALFERVGGFESWLRPRRGIELGEDILFGWRARRAGARTAFCATALVHHAVHPRGAGAYVAERARLRFFPAIAARVPELRARFFYRRWFLSRRTAAFDLALAALALGAARRRPAALAVAAPYGAQLAHHALRAGPRRAPLVAVADLAADVVGAGALLAGSARARALLL